MHLTQWMSSLVLASFLFSGPLMAAGAVSATEPAQLKQAGKLDKIGGAPAAAEHDTKDCPMHKGKKECEHKHGEPCPYHQDEKHLGKSHEKCDHKQHG